MSDEFSSEQRFEDAVIRLLESGSSEQRLDKIEVSLDNYREVQRLLLAKHNTIFGEGDAKDFEPPF